MTNATNLIASKTYTVPQAARELGVTDTAIYQRYHNGSLEGFKNAYGNIVIPAEKVEELKSLKNTRMKSGVMSIKKAAEKLNIAKSTVKAMLQDGRLTPQNVNGHIKVSVQEVMKLNKIQNDPNYMTNSEIAAHLNVRKTTVDGWISQGKLKRVTKIGVSYYRKSDADTIYSTIHAITQPVHHATQAKTVGDHLTIGQVAEILGTSKNTVTDFADYGFLKADRAVINGRPSGERMFDKEFLAKFMEFHGITKGNPEKVVLTRSDNQQFRFTLNYIQAVENGIVPDIHRLTHEGYDRLNGYGEVVSSKKGLVTTATNFQKKPFTLKFNTKPEISINGNGATDLNQATKEYTQILLDAAKHKIDHGEFEEAKRLIQLAETNHNSIEALKDISCVQTSKVKTN